MNTDFLPQRPQRNAEKEYIPFEKINPFSKGFIQTFFRADTGVCPYDRRKAAKPRSLTTKKR